MSKSLLEKASYKERSEGFILYLQKGMKKFKVALEVTPYIEQGLIKNRVDVTDAEPKK